MSPDSISPERAEELKNIMEELESMNHEAMANNLWIRTKWNSANQKPWHTYDAEPPAIPEHGLPLENAKPVPHIWKWNFFSNYLQKLADLCPLELTERQSVLLTNPSFSTGYKVTNTMRIAISIYKKGDNAVPHMHAPNASRTILSEGAGYTYVEGERLPAYRGDLILTPNGTWHAHGNDDDEPVIWADTLDWPLMDFLGLIWVRNDHENAKLNDAPDQGFSTRFYGTGGMLPRFQGPGRGSGKKQTEMFYYAGSDIRTTLKDLRGMDGDPHEGIIMEFVNPKNGRPIFPSLRYQAQLLRPGEETLEFRHTANTVYSVLEGEGITICDGKEMEWSQSDFFVTPSHLWRKHKNTGSEDAILYSYSDSPVIECIGHYNAQGRTKAGSVIELADD
ncbi:MAG: cupin domain-containing protein [Rhodospirillaceae bacterium]|nr:cupin domain-containing protein [Rhodospirillaceae bacterium]